MSRHRISKFVFFLSAVLLISAAAAARFIKPPENTDEVRGDMSNPADFFENPLSEEEKIRRQAEIIKSDSEYKDGFFTLLAVGLDFSENLTDTIAAVTFDTKNKTAAVLNIPRDTISEAPWGGTHKINAAYGSGGIERTAFEVSKLTGYTFDRYAVVDYDAFRAVIDAIGGVEVEVGEDMYKNTGDMVIDLKKGLQTLDGEHALMYMRYRGYAMADIDRIKAQQKLYSAAAEKLTSPGIILKLPALAQAVLDNVKTDLSLGEMIWLGLNYSDMNGDSIVYNTLPCRAEYIDGISYVIPDEDKTLELINGYYNPYKNNITGIETAKITVSKKIENEKEPVTAPQNDFDTVPDWLR